VKTAKLIYLLAGAALFAALLFAFDLEAALALIWQAGPLGIAALCLVYFALFALDTLVWLALVPELPRSLAWYRRLVRVRLAGEALNLVVPAGGMGGEPLKAMLLKSQYGVGYQTSSAGLVLQRIHSLVGQFLFVAMALVLMAAATDLPPLYQTGAWIGLAVFAGMTGAFILTPKLRLSSRLGRRLGGRRWARSIAEALAGIEAVEDKINAFARAHRARYVLSMVLVTLRWMLGAAEMWLALHLLGHPVSVAEAIVIEGFLQLARAVSFFVPAALGTQDGALALVASALTGVAAVGLGAALLRRVREIIFIALGFAMGGWYSLRRPRRADADAGSADGPRK
jgi:uncharacterized protein (TIRG00374 family)